MTTDALFAVFADFNDYLHVPPPPPVEDEVPAVDPLAQVREEAWTEGYMTGRREPGSETGDGRLTARLLTSLQELDSKTASAVDAASLAVADLLISTVIAVASDEWPRKLLSRVQMVAERIKPALVVAPEFVLRDDRGTERRFDDISGLSRALDDGVISDNVTIKWQRGEATISRTALLEDLREAVMPLSAGLANEQSAGNST